MRHIVFSPVLVIPCLVASTALADTPASPDTPYSGGVFVTDVHAAGSGCDDSSLLTDFAPDFSTLDVLLGQGFVAQVGPGIAPSERRKNCVITFTIHVPPGLSFALTSAEFEGFAMLDAGVTGAQSATYWIAGDPNRRTGVTNLAGEYWGTYERHDNEPEPVWSPCGGDQLANIDAQVWTNNAGNRAGTGYVSLDMSDVHVHGAHVRWFFRWRTC